MSIEVPCTHCGKRLRVPDTATGRRVRCPSCQTILNVPADLGAAPNPSGVTKYYLQTPDGQNFGPISKQELDQWAGEGRVTATCQILAEGSDQWQWATDYYPHLAQATAPGASGIDIGGPSAAENPFEFAAGGSSVVARSGIRSGVGKSGVGQSGIGKAVTQARRKIKAPAFMLLMSGILNVALSGLLLILIPTGLLTQGLENAPGIDRDAIMLQRAIYAVSYSIVLIANCFVAYAALGMQNLRGWGLSMTASIVSVIPCFACYMIGLPVGIWCIVALNSPEVKTAFR